MADLKGSQTEQALQRAFAAESQATWRYRYFAAIAEFEGLEEAATRFKEAAESDALSAQGNIDFLRQSGDPETGLPLGETIDNLAAAVALDQRLAVESYPQLAQQARDEGFDDIADWFETLAKAKRRHAALFQKLLDTQKG
jgi:rubrerythrin